MPQRQVKKTIVAPNGDSLEISFTYSLATEDITGVTVKVWNKDRTQGFDLTELFEEDINLYRSMNKIIQEAIYEQ